MQRAIFLARPVIAAISAGAGGLLFNQATAQTGHSPVTPATAPLSCGAWRQPRAYTLASSPLEVAATNTQAFHDGLNCEEVDERSPVARLAAERAKLLPFRQGGHGSRAIQWRAPWHRDVWQGSIVQRAPAAGPSSSADTWDLLDTRIIYFCLPLIQALLAPQHDLERLLRCPTCGEASSTASPLKSDGAAKLRRVFGPACTLYIFSNKYRHISCPKGTLLDAATGKRGARSFDGRHAAVQQVMPLWVQQLLPVVFTHCGAVEKAVLQQMFLDLPRGVPAAQIARRLREQGQHRRAAQQLSYLAAAADTHSAGTQLALGQSAASAAPQPLSDIPGGAYYGSAKWLLAVWLQDLQVSGQLSYAQRCLTAVRGRYLRLDHTFSICSGAQPASDERCSLLAAEVLGDVQGAMQTRHFAAGTPADQALEALRTPLVSGYLMQLLAEALAARLPAHAAEALSQPRAEPRAAAAVPTDTAAAARDAQAASRRLSREQLTEPGDSLPPLLLTHHAQQASAPSQLPSQPAAFAAAQPISLGQLFEAGFLQFMAQQPALPGLLSIPQQMPPAAAPEAATPAAAVPATRRGGLGTPKTCSLCKQPKRGTHQQGCPTHCEDCRLSKPNCRCGR